MTCIKDMSVDVDVTYRTLNIIYIILYLHMTRMKDMRVDVDVTYRTLNIMAEEERYIYFISDPPHLIKSACNSLLVLVDVHVVCGIMVIF